MKQDIDLIDAVAALRARVERLEAALRPFATLCPGSLDAVGGGTVIAPSVKVGWIKDARAALEPTPAANP